jgi:hypothetical protein
VVATVYARQSASAGSSTSVGSQRLPAPFGSLSPVPSRYFGLSSNPRLSKPRDLLQAARPGGYYLVDHHVQRPASIPHENKGPPSNSYVDRCTSLAFDHLQSLQRERCKSVERSRTKRNPAPSSKSRCRPQLREVFVRHSRGPRMSCLVGLYLLSRDRLMQVVLSSVVLTLKGSFLRRSRRFLVNIQTLPAVLTAASPKMPRLSARAECTEGRDPPSISTVVISSTVCPCAQCPRRRIDRRVASPVFSW